MSTTQGSCLIHFLEHVAARPAMYFGTADVNLAVQFLAGFHAALYHALFVESRHAKDQVIRDRGWQLPRATGPGIEHQMLSAGLSPEQVINELVAIEIEVIKRSACYSLQ
jgi:hypothetical protein